MDTNKIFIDMAQRAHEFAEMCERMANETKQKADPEAWREENLKKQAAGVRFEFLPSYSTRWERGDSWSFLESKERYREVPQQPHAAERALWKAQREAGTNEVWQVLSGNGVADIRVDVEPNWHPDFIYRVKPMKLTARIIRLREFYPRMAQPACLVQNWEFAGTREEYRAECEKYGYVVVSEIKEVKPKTVKYYFALMKNSAGEISVEWCDESNLSTLEKMGSGWSGHTIIGDIEERDV